MIAPLIKGASRVRKSSSNVLHPAARAGSKKTLTRAERSANLRAQAKIALYQELIGEEEDDEKREFFERSKRLTQKTRALKKAIPMALTGVKRIKAGVASSFIFYSAIPFYVPQVGFWILALAGIGTESIPFANYVLPGQSLFMLSHIIVMIIGITTMMYALIIYTSRLVNCFGGFKFLVFAVCIAMYSAPVLNGAPWFLLWLAFVTYAQGKPKDEEEES